jgi:hypothetical protein
MMIDMYVLQFSFKKFQCNINQKNRQPENFFYLER